MDVVTTAIIAGAAAGAGDVAQAAIGDAYQKLKEIISQKLGKSNKLTPAIEDLEAEPDFDPHKAVVEGRVNQTGANEDPEIQAAAEKLLDKLESEFDTPQQMQRAVGKNIAQVIGSGRATVSVNQSDRDEE